MILGLKGLTERSIRTDKFEQFWAVNRRLMERTGDDPYFKHIPFRIFQVVYKPVFEVAEHSYTIIFVCLASFKF